MNRRLESVLTFLLFFSLSALWIRPSVALTQQDPLFKVRLQGKSMEGNGVRPGAPRGFAALKEQTSFPARAPIQGNDPGRSPVKAQETVESRKQRAGYEEGVRRPSPSGGDRRAGASARRPRLLLLGDSITKGVVIPPTGPPYSEIVAELLGEIYEVVNIGVPAARSIDWTLSMPRSYPSKFELHAVQELPADVVSILLGTNDAVTVFGSEYTLPPVYEMALEEIIGLLSQYGARHIVLMTPPQNFCFGPVGYVNLMDYREVVFDLCARYSHVSCGPDLFKLLDPYSHFRGCQTHPTARAHQIIADALYGHIFQLGR
jgi:lysophospholipase L1-like esterase